MESQRHTTPSNRRRDFREGFALVESGFCRAKNTVNILSKNFIVFAISCLAFYLFGWGLMFGNGSAFIGAEGLFAIRGADNFSWPGR